MAGLSCFLSQAPWEVYALEEQWLKHFREEREPMQIAARWDIEVLFGDGKEELGLDQYQPLDRNQG